jgi:hypothetical protein
VDMLMASDGAMLGHARARGKDTCNTGFTTLTACRGQKCTLSQAP